MAEAARGGYQAIRFFRKNGMEPGWVILVKNGNQAKFASYLDETGQPRRHAMGHSSMTVGGQQPGMGMQPGMMQGGPRPGMMQRPGMGMQPGMMNPQMMQRPGMGMQPGMMPPMMQHPGMMQRPGMGVQPGMMPPMMQRPGMGMQPGMMNPQMMQQGGMGMQQSGGAGQEKKYNVIFNGAVLKGGVAESEVDKVLEKERLTRSSIGLTLSPVG